VSDTFLELLFNERSTEVSLGGVDYAKFAYDTLFYISFLSLLSFEYNPKCLQHLKIPCQ